MLACSAIVQWRAQQICLVWNAIAAVGFGQHKPVIIVCSQRDICDVAEAGNANRS